MSQKIKSHLGWAIVSFVLFWPLGLVALIKAIKAKGAISRGDSDADILADNARKWCKITTFTWLILVILGVAAGITVGCLLSSAL